MDNDMDGWIVVGGYSAMASSSTGVELQRQLRNRRSQRELRRCGILKTRSDGTRQMRFFGRKHANSSRAFERHVGGSQLVSQSAVDQLQRSKTQSSIAPKLRRSKSASPAAMAKIQELMRTIESLKTTQARLRGHPVCTPGQWTIGALQKQQNQSTVVDNHTRLDRDGIRPPHASRWIIGMLEKQRQKHKNKQQEPVPSSPKFQWIISALVQRNGSSTAVAQPTPNENHNHRKNKNNKENGDKHFFQGAYHYTNALFEFIESENEQAP